MSDYKSFTYQTTQNFDLGITSRCVVHFRPHAKWEGKDYGFGWMRITDTNVFGDEKHYKEIVCNHYKRGTTTLENDPNAYRGTFVVDPLKFAKLETEYNPLLILSASITPPLAIPTYHCSWLALFAQKNGTYKATNKKAEKVIAKIEKLILSSIPAIYKNTKATLRLYLEVAEAPDYLEFEDNPNFKITPKKITDDLGEGKRFWKQGETVTIECLYQFNKDQRINIFSYKKDPATGQYISKLAGRLYVWANDSSKIKNAKIVLVKVKTPPFMAGRGALQGSYTQGEKESFGKYFIQALIRSNVEECELDLARDTTFANRYHQSNKFHMAKQVNLSQLGDYMDVYLYNKLKQKLQAEGMDANKYDGYYQVFFMGGTDVQGMAAYGNSDSDNAVFYSYPGQPDANADHELLHLFKIDHSFSNKRWDSLNALYTYEARKTENIMDYSHKDGQKCFALWYWQWKIANSNIK